MEDLNIFLVIIALPFGILFLGLPSFALGMFIRSTFGSETDDPLKNIGSFIGTTIIGFIAMIVIVLIFDFLWGF